MERWCWCLPPCPFTHSQTLQMAFNIFEAWPYLVYRCYSLANMDQVVWKFIRWRFCGCKTYEPSTFKENTNRLCNVFKYPSILQVIFFDCHHWHGFMVWNTDQGIFRSKDFFVFNLIRRHSPPDRAKQLECPDGNDVIRSALFAGSPVVLLV